MLKFSGSLSPSIWFIHSTNMFWATNKYISGHVFGNERVWSVSVHMCVMQGNVYIWQRGRREGLRWHTARRSWVWDSQWDVGEWVGREGNTGRKDISIDDTQVWRWGHVYGQAKVSWPHCLASKDYWMTGWGGWIGRRGQRVEDSECQTPGLHFS